jgi:4-hydroxy 2-oxovalerate aldolase
LIGGGPSAVEHSDALDAFLVQNPDILVVHASSKNALSFTKILNDQIFCLVGNEGHRLEQVFGNREIKGKCVLPPYPRTMGTYIPKAVQKNAYELEKVSFINKYQDSHTAIALQTVVDSGINEVFVTGYDAYKGEITLKEQELFTENQFLFRGFKSFRSSSLISLTPTAYDELNETSVYSLID